MGCEGAPDSLEATATWLGPHSWVLGLWVSWHQVPVVLASQRQGVWAGHVPEQCQVPEPCPLHTPDLRLQLLDVKNNPYLIKALYGLLMLLPQSSAFQLLSHRLQCVPNPELLQTE